MSQQGICDFLNMLSSLPNWYIIILSGLYMHGVLLKVQVYGMETALSPVHCPTHSSL